VEPFGGQKLRHGFPDRTGIGKAVNQYHGGLAAFTEFGQGQLQAASADPSHDSHNRTRLHLFGSHRRRCTTDETSMLTPCLVVLTESMR
jgi:hypothetical protein